MHRPVHPYIAFGSLIIIAVIIGSIIWLGNNQLAPSATVSPVPQISIVSSHPSLKTTGSKLLNSLEPSTIITSSTNPLPTPSYIRSALKANEANNVYNNSKYGYSFVIPKGIEAHVNDYFLKENLVQQDIAIYKEPNENLNLSVFINGKSDLYKAEDIKTSGEYKKIIINQQEAWKNVDTGTSGMEFFTVVFFGNKYIYVLQTSGYKDLTLVNSIINSFHVLNQ